MDEAALLLTEYHIVALGATLPNGKKKNKRTSNINSLECRACDISTFGQHRVAATLSEEERLTICPLIRRSDFGCRPDVCT